VKGRILAGEETGVRLYGYTVVDSIKTIYALSGYDFYRIFGATTERALVFTKVGMGRSPLVAIRVSQLKPRMVVIHGPKELDPLALELAKREGIVLALSGCDSEETLIASMKALQ
jgi:putative transcriptional regulator